MMATAPSHQEREGAPRPESRGKADAAPTLLSLRRGGQGIDYEEATDLGRLHPATILNTKTVTIVSGPVSFRTLAFWGIVIFLVAFLHGRQMSRLGNAAVNSTPREPAPAAQAPTGTSASSQQSAASTPRVTIRLLKYFPDTIEIKTGDTVEWTNSDLTPHTVTSQGAGDLNSGSIEAGASWRHTFTQQGTFAYFCSFHPEMKGVVTVK